MIIVHVITSLLDGGAEAVLYRLCAADKINSHVVISMRDEGKYGPMLRQIEIKVYCLKMPRGRLTLNGIWTLYRLFRVIRPDVVQTWMYHADLIGGLLARMARVKRIFWGIRHSNLESSHTGKSTIAVAKLCALLSFWVPSGIVSCSIKGIEVHKAFGYDKKKFTFIPNGYDPNEFIPNQVVGNEIRKSLQIPDGIPILGMVARYNVQKDHGNLLLALKQLKLNCVDFRCALIGAGMTRENTELMDLLASLGINSNVLLLGQRNDIPAIMNSLDIHVLSSSCGEGFPNVLCEAMACGTVCVTTDVGDAATIVSDTGWIVPPRSPDLLFRALLEAIGELLETRSHWRQRKNLVRQRITKNYSIDEMTNRFQSLWSNVGQ